MIFIKSHLWVWISSGSTVVSIEDKHSGLGLKAPGTTILLHTHMLFHRSSMFTITSYSMKNIATLICRLGDLYVKNKRLMVFREPPSCNLIQSGCKL